MILKNYTSIYILLLYLFSIQIMGQTPLTNAEIKSPQSYAFEKYGNVPVNLYMGAIDLKIPITTIGNNEVNISTDLNYDSSGFVPHKKSDAAGIGWSILAGGRITRIVNGTADEYIGNNLEDAYQVNPYGNALDLHGFIKGTKSNSATTNIQAYNLNGGSGNTNGTWWWMGSPQIGTKLNQTSLDLMLWGYPENLLWGIMVKFLSNRVIPILKLIFPSWHSMEGEIFVSLLPHLSLL